MEIYQLRQFLAVVEMRSFTRAATHVGVSQPALSAGISKLEEELGVTLVNRDRRAISLTPHGQRFATRARQILDACSLARTEARPSDAREQVRLGVLSSLPMHKIIALARACLRAFPEVTFEFREETSADLYDLLEKGKIDFAIAAARSGTDDDDQSQLFQESYMLACHVDHPFAHRDVISLGDVHEENFVLRTTCEARRATQETLAARGIRPRVVARTAQDDRALSLVAAGIGLALMPALFVSPGVMRVPIADYEMTRRIVVRRQAKQPAAAAESLFRFLSRIDLRCL
jgi:DNA-binding transcriptional LysR family regulator